MESAVRVLERALALDLTDETTRRKLHRELGHVGWGQCDLCGGLGESDTVHTHTGANCAGCDAGNRCEVCKGLGALPPGHDRIRKCDNIDCQAPLLPDHVAVYCSNECAWRDAV